jgi:hypothetical protein
MSEQESSRQDTEGLLSRLLGESDPKPERGAFFGTAEAEQLAERTDGVFIVLDLLQRINPEGQGREMYLTTLIENGRSWHVFHMLTEWGGVEHIDTETFQAVLDIAIETGNVRDIISSWENMGDDVMTEERLVRMRHALAEDETGLERFDEKYPDIKGK